MTAIGDSAFYNCSDLAALTLGTGVVTVGDSAFAETNITELTLPDGLETIGEEAFSQTKITTLELPASLTAIGKNAFSFTPLTAVTWAGVPTGLETLQGFTSCTSLTSFEIPVGVTAIGDQAFYSCDLRAVTIPGSVESIGEDAFSANTGLASLTIVPSATPLFIGRSAFAGASLKKLTLPKRVTTISEASFENGCSAIFTIENPELAIAVPKLNWGPVVTYPVTVGGQQETAYVSDPWYFTSYNGTPDPADRVTVRYPNTMNSPTFAEYMLACEETLDTSRRLYPIFEEYTPSAAEQPEIPEHTVSGTLPEGAEITILSGAEPLEVTMDGNDFSATAKEGLAVTVIVTKPGYTAYTASNDLKADWAVPAIVLTPLSQTGALTVTVTGPGAVAGKANIAVIGAGDKLAAMTVTSGGACTIPSASTSA